MSRDAIHDVAGVPHVSLREAHDLLTYRFDPSELSLKVDLLVDAMAVNRLDMGRASATGGVPSGAGAKSTELP